jgi:enoyl-CoA hydratase/carnithine racemase
VRVGWSLDGSLGLVELRRPERRNAIDPAMAAELAGALAALAATGPRALLLTAAGPAFCAGRDIAAVDPADDDGYAVLTEVFNPLVQAVYDFPAPTFAAVQGACVGAGLGLALACDVVYAADDARLGSPFARLGAVLDSGGHAFLTRRVGAARTLELVYTGRLLSGVEAAAWGLVNASVPGPELAAAARAAALAAAAGPTRAFAESRRIVRRLADAPLPLAEVLALEAGAQGRAGRTADYREGFAAFQAKRQPDFSGR